MIQADLIRQYRSDPVTETYGPREVMLYALGIGAGADERDLHYVYEKNLSVVPTFALVMAREKFWLDNPEFGINLGKMLHGEQGLEIHRPLQPSATVTARLTVEALHDKGEGKGALLVMKRMITDAQSGDPIATIRITSFLRADGGFGGQSDPVQKPHIIPERAPDQIVAHKTSPEQALLYRLSGDYNPIHMDRTVAEKAGFPGPILHGLCTYGIACRAVLRAACDDDSSRLKRFNARFSNPVFPGDLIVTEVWKDGNVISFRCWVPERAALVLNNGLAEITN